jgi:A/G-specific adenine glycosylase
MLCHKWISRGASPNFEYCNQELNLFQPDIWQQGQIEAFQSPSTMLNSHCGLSTTRYAWPLSADTLAVCRSARQSRLARERIVAIYASNNGSEDTEDEDNDLIARLKAAEEEAKALKQELNRVQAATTKAEEGAPGTKSPPSAVSRIDGADLRRETLSFVENKPRNWLSESDIEFFTGGGPSEAGTQTGPGQGVDASESSEDAVVQRRLAIGIGLSVVLGAFALVPTEKLQPPPSKPLFFYLVPLIRTQEILKEVIDILPDGDYDKLRTLLSRIEGAPNNVQENLKSAVASISDARIAGKADLIARDAYEYLKGIDYQTYYESRSMEGQQLKEMFDFSSNSAQAAQRKLEEFLSLMPEDEVMAARQQVSQSYY